MSKNNKSSYICIIWLKWHLVKYEKYGTLSIHDVDLLTTFMSLSILCWQHAKTIQPPTNHNFKHVLLVIVLSCELFWWTKIEFLRNLVPEIAMTKGITNLFSLFEYLLPNLINNCLCQLLFSYKSNLINCISNTE